MQLKIDPEFRDKVPPLTAQELIQLEENIVKDGRVLNPIVVWGDTIVDGHNRYSIIQKHPEIPYAIKEMKFADRYEAIVWICRNQLGRRNLTNEQKAYLIGKQYEAERHHEPFHGNQHTRKSGDDQSGQGQTGATRQRIAKETGTSEGYVQRAEKFAKGIDTAEKLSPGIKDAVLSGEVKAPKAVIASIPAMPEPEQKKTVQAIVTGKSMSAREMGKLFDRITAESAEKEQQAYTADDLKEELDALIQDFTRKVKTTLTVHSTVLSEEIGVKKATAALSEAETAVRKLRGLIPYG